MSSQRISKLVNTALLVLHAGRTIRDDLSGILSQEKLSLESWLILSVLDEKDGLSMSELSDSLGMRISGVSKNVDRLVKRALLYRQQDINDHRRVLLFVSKFGQDALARLEFELERYGLKVQKHVRERHLQEFVNLLEASGSKARINRTAYNE